MYQLLLIQYHMFQLRRTRLWYSCLLYSFTRLYVNQFIFVDEDEDQQPSFQSYSEPNILY